MNTIRYLSFEVNNRCRNAKMHADKCPILHPERYKFSKSKVELSDEIVINFWRWCRTKGFRGIVLWHMYNEPVMILDRLRYIMSIMKLEDKFQPFQLTTSIIDTYPDFDIVKISNYNEGTKNMDNRILTNTGEGRPYWKMPSEGWCGRGLGWEIPIDHFGNWCLCCGDWRCEEAVGSICTTKDWDVLYNKWKEKRAKIRWCNEATYKALPRMCRACLHKNPSLSRQGGV